MLSSKYRLSQLIILLLFTTMFSVIFFKVQHESPSLATFIFYFTLAILLGTFFKSPIFVFDDKTIKRVRFFQRCIYLWDDVEAVQISVKSNYPFYIFGWPVDAMKITFKNGKSFFIFDGIYSNIAVMRSFVTDKLNDRLQFFKLPHQRFIAQTILHKTYKGNMFTSARTLVIAVFVVFFIIQFRNQPHIDWLILLPLTFGICLYLAFGFQMNYFEIENDKLIIKNQYFPWKKRMYNLNEIEEVSKESGYRVAEGLRIITYDFQSKLYRAGSLGIYKWDELFTDFKSLGIKISD